VHTYAEVLKYLQTRSNDPEEDDVRRNLEAWFVSASVEGISYWLHSSTSFDPSLRLGAAEFTENVRARLLLPLVSDNTFIGGTCGCDSVLCSYHCFACPLLGGIRKYRHDQVMLEVIKFFNKVILKKGCVMKEFKLSNPMPGEKARVADIALFHETVIKFFDGVISDPCCPTVKRDVEDHAIPGEAARASAHSKRVSYSTRHGPDILPLLIPLSFESTGRYGVESMAIINELSGLTGISFDADLKIKNARLYLQRRISILMANCTAYSIRAYRNRLRFSR